MLNAGFHDVPFGHVATVVTHLEMRSPAALRPAPNLPGLDLRRVKRPDLNWYRDLYSRVGGLDWLWFSRLEMPDEVLEEILNDPLNQVFALSLEGQDQGLMELDFRAKQACELAFFGLTKQLQGTGAGRWLINQAITLAWEMPVRRFDVHTCTLDHPAALQFYIRSGFKPIRQQIEIAPDPRLSGTLPRGAGAHIPIFDPD